MLTVALAEGLGYGRDRALLQSIGQRLVSGESPSVLRADGAVWPRVERARLDGLLALWERWEPLGPWKALEPLVGAMTARAAARGMIEALVVRPGLISPGRAAILTANVALPFAAAWASLIDDAALGVSARGAYSALPGLPSNQITREMMRQLGLPRSPVGAIAQQGLQHIWNEHCRDKRCSACPCAIVLHATNERPLPASERTRSAQRASGRGSRD